jgi:hypothetical protein
MENSPIKQNNALIQGAGMTTGNQQGGFVNPMVGFAAGVGQPSQAAIMARRQNEYKKRQNQIELTNFVNNMGDVPINKVEESMRDEVNQFLITKRNEYAEAARQAAILDAQDPEYAKAVSKMNEINLAFKNLSANLDSFKQKREQFYEDEKNNVISDASRETGNVDRLNSLFKNSNYDITIGPGGSFTIFNDGQYIPFEDLSKDSEYNYFLVNNEGFNSIMDLTNTVHSNAAKLEGGYKTNISYKLNNIINSMGREDLLSMAYDNVLGSEIPIVDREDFYEQVDINGDPIDLLMPENDELLRKYLINNVYMDSLSTVADKAHRQKEKDNAPKKSMSMIRFDAEVKKINKRLESIGMNGQQGQSVQGVSGGRSVVWISDGQGGTQPVAVKDGSIDSNVIFYSLDDIKDYLGTN